MREIGFLLLGTLVSALGAYAAAGGGRGLAAKYPGDAGIERDPAFIFGDTFERWGGDGSKPPKGTWHGVYKRSRSRARVVAGVVTSGGRKLPGRKVFENACWGSGGKSTVAGIYVKLGNYQHAREGLGKGYEDIYLRYYIRFSRNFKSVRNHGPPLGGRDVTRRDAWWVGQADIRDVSSKGYYWSSVEPHPRWGRSTPLILGFYSYHLDKSGRWGDHYKFIKKITIQPGRWYCLERHMKLNTARPLKADGLEELWIDGELSIRRERLRFRKVPQLRITYFSLQNYFHGLPSTYTAQRPITVQYDNVVIARKYIGPIGTKRAAPESAGGLRERRNEPAARSRGQR